MLFQNVTFIRCQQLKVTVSLCLPNCWIGLSRDETHLSLAGSVIVS